MTNDATADLGESLLTTGQVFGLLRQTQLGQDTPCDGWSVGELVDHMIDMLGMYSNAFGSTQPKRRPVDGDSLPDAVDAYREGSARLLEAVSGATAGTMVTVPFGTVPSEVAIRLATVETLVHGWDLATATAQTYECNPAVVERALAFSVPALAMLPPDRSPFAPTVSVEDHAPAIDRLVGLLGRQP